MKVEVYKPNCSHQDHWFNVIVWNNCWHCGLSVPKKKKKVEKNNEDFSGASYFGNNER